MINNIINFLTHNITLSVGFLLAIIVYILFEVVSWLSSDSLENQSKVNVNQLTSLFNHENALILDLRSAENYNASYIINSVNILPVDCNNQNTLIKSNPNRPIIIVCETGKISASVAIHLRKNGIKQAFYLAGGLAAWRASGMPLVTSNKGNPNNKYLEKIVIYTKEGCPYCLSAKNLLRNKGLKYKEVTISVDQQEFKEMVQLSGGLKTVPQIFINGRHIGGFDALKDLNDKGELDNILKNI